jgi:leader peptidase (prepilin peptidase)/N-methyltransferase
METLFSMHQGVPAWILPLLCAPFVGSFLGVVIARLPAGRPVALARSVCDECGVTLAPRELIPIASFLLQRGRCRRCGTRIAPFHLAVELAALLVVIWAAAVDRDSARLWLDCLLGWTLMTVSWIDWQSFWLPDTLTLPLLLAGLLVTLLLRPDAAADHAAAAAAGYAGLRAVGWGYRFFSGREGIGGGDAKLLAAAGAWVGLAALPLVILLAAMFGLVIALVLALAGREMRSTTPLPFGPSLALALWLLWLHDPSIAAVLNGDLSWFGLPL